MLTMRQHPATMANLILILLSKENSKSITQSDLIYQMQQRGFHIDGILDVLSVLVHRGYVNREQSPEHNLLFASSAKYNWTHSPILSSPFLLNVFAPITNHDDPNPEYELIAISHRHFSDWVKWEDDIVKIHEDPAYRSIGASIIETAILMIAKYVGQTRAEPYYVPARWLIPRLQSTLFGYHPLLSPLVIQAYVEHPFIKTCLHMEELKQLHPNDGRTDVAYGVHRVIKLPTREECLTVVGA